MCVLALVVRLVFLMLGGGGDDCHDVVDGGDAGDGQAAGPAGEHGGARWGQCDQS